MRENTAEILHLSNYEVLVAQNGKEGVETALREHPDLIICDIMMPILDGYGVLHLLSKNEDTAGIPFIFLSAKADRTDLRKGMDMGADDYLTKPFDDIELLRAIESRLKKAETMKKEFSKNLDGLSNFISDAISLDALKDMSVLKEIRTYRRKEIIYTQDGHPKGVYFIISGKIKTYKLNDQHKEFITGLYKEGDFFGYLSLLDQDKNLDCATAMEDSEICMIPRDDFFSIIYKNQDVAKSFIKLLADNLKESEEHLLKLAYDSVRKKVADALVMLYDKYNMETTGDNVVVISREDLASIAGTATESTIRSLGDFKEDGIVEVHSSKIVILDYKALKEMHN